MWEYEGTNKSISQGISRVGVVLVKGTQSVCMAVLRIPMVADTVKFHSPPLLEGPLLILSSPVLKESAKIFILGKKKTEEVSPVGE